MKGKKELVRILNSVLFLIFLSSSLKIGFAQEYQPVIKEIYGLGKVAQLTGEDSFNQTDKVDVYGTDLGIMGSLGGRLYFIFGDTFGRFKSNWRSNTMAFTTNLHFQDGITFDGWITDRKDQAKELITSLKKDHTEITTIPTTMVGFNEKLYVFYMSVKHWGSPGEWWANYSSLAYSDNEGRSWVKAPRVKWNGESNFVQLAASLWQDELYLLATPAGRFGGVKLMKVEPSFILDTSRYRYFVGYDSQGKPLWSSQEEKALTIIPKPVGEMSLMYNRFLERFLLTYLNAHSHDLELREAPYPWGPWSEPFTLVEASQYPGLYGAFMHPWLVENNGETIYFTMSLWFRYNVFLMKVSFKK